MSFKSRSRSVSLFETRCLRVVLAVSQRLFSMPEGGLSAPSPVPTVPSPSPPPPPPSNTADVDPELSGGPTIDENDPSKGTPTGWSLFNPEIRVRVCHRVPHPQARVRELMFDCTQYARWWPRTYNFTLERCTPETVDSIVHFKSPVGDYKCKLTVASTDSQGVTRLRQNYFEGILSGDMEWQISRIDDASCKLCYDASLKPTSITAQVAAAVSSREYLASYFEPLVTGLKVELKREQDEKQQRQQQ